MRNGLGRDVRLAKERVHAFAQARWNLVAGAGVREQLAEPAAELGAIHARPAPGQVRLDLGAVAAEELSVEVELDLAQDLFTVDR